MNAAIKGEALTLVYTLLTILVAVVALTIFFSKLPEIKDEAIEGSSERSPLFSFRQLKLGVFGIFFYVGAETGVGTFIGEYLSKDGGLTVAQGAQIAALYYLMAMVGRFAGAPILKFVSSQKVLLITSLINIGLITFAIITPNDSIINTGGLSKAIGAEQLPLAVIFLILIGLFNSVMWGCIFSLAVDGLGTLVKQASGYLMTAAVGGAVMPLLQGFVNSGIGVKLGFIVCIICYFYLAYYAANGWKPNKTDIKL